MNQEPDKVRVGPHGGPGGVSSESSPGTFIDEVGAGPRGGPGSLSAETEPTPEEIPES